MRKNIFILLSVFFFLQLPAQEAKKDSLLLALREAQEDTNKVNALNTLASMIRYAEPYEAMRYAGEAKDLAKKLNFRTGLSLSYNFIGIIHMTQGDYPEALQNLIEGLKIREELGNRKGVAASLNNIGNVYYLQGDYQNAIDNYQRSLAVREELGDRRNMAVPYNNIGAIYSEQGKYEEALEYFQRSLTIKEEIGSKQGVANSYLNMGEALRGLKRYAESEEYYSRALKILEEIDDQMGIVAVYTGMAELDIEREQYALAVAYLKAAIELSEKLGSKFELKEAYELMATAHERQGDYEQAYYYNTLFANTKDSLLNEESKKQITEMQTKYESEKKEIELGQKAAEVKQQETQKYATIGGLALAISLLLVALNGFRQKQKDNVLLSEQKQEIETQRDELEDKNKKITESIDYAKRIQESVLPQQSQLQEHFPESFIFYKPKDIVSGDFFWLCEKEEEVLIAAVDCTGHGVPGAFMSVVGYNLLEQAARVRKLTKPNEILDDVNRSLDEVLQQNTEKHDVKDGMDLALCSINKKTNELLFSGANNPLWIIRKDGAAEELKGDKISLGSQLNEQFSSHKVQLHPGDSVHVFTDGYADQKGGAKNKKFYYQPFQDLLTELKREGKKNYVPDLDRRISSWKGAGEQLDDMLVVGVHIT